MKQTNKPSTIPTLTDTLRPLWQDATAAIRMAVLRRAGEFGWFNLLQTPQSMKMLADHAGLSSRETMFFLTLLCSMELLQQKNGDYCLNDAYRPLFTDGSQQYFADALYNRIVALSSYAAMIGKMGVCDQSICGTTTPLSWEQAGKQHLFQDQKALIAPFAAACIEHYQSLLPAKEHSHFLDLGGNPGNVALTLCQKNAGFTGTVFDLPETENVITANIAQQQMQQRVKIKTGIFPNDDIGLAEYDFIWCSQLFYFIENAGSGLKQIHRALKPGGLLLFAHAELPGDATYCRVVLPWYMNMYLKNMNIPAEGEWQKQLRGANFRILQDDYAENFPVAPLKVLIAQKE